MINYRTVADLNYHIVSALPKLPRNIDLIVGIPRSGFLAGSLFALHLNCALTDPKGFLENRIMNFGLSRGGFRPFKSVREARAILVVDDSIYSGNQMAQTRAILAEASRGLRVHYGAVYALPESKGKVDVYCDICPRPRIFEWNLMHDCHLERACLDLDGVLCCDPTEDENDDGPRYLHFVENAVPFLLPMTPIGYIVTCRLEKYRIQTEKWLHRYDVKYQRLIMMDLPSKKSRLEAGNHGLYKADVCRRLGARFFIESNLDQAITIANRADADVFCTQSRTFITPSTAELMKQALKNSPNAFKGAVKKVVRRGLTFINRQAR